MINTAEEFQNLCANEDDTTFAHQAAALDIWIEILSRYPHLERCVASNKTIPNEIIERLSMSNDIDVRWKIATKRKLDTSIFERLATDSDPTIRHRIACNPKTPKHILQILSKDSDPMVASSAMRKLCKLKNRASQLTQGNL